MIKIYTTNQNGKIELTKQELMELIEEVKQECRKENPQPAQPAIPNQPNQPIWITPYCTATADDVRYRKNDATDKGEIFSSLAKELNF